MTDVILQHLITDEKIRIKTRDYVKKIAVYRSRLAVQLPKHILIYEETTDSEHGMRFKLMFRVNKALECNLLVVTAMNLILCQEKRLQLYDFKGECVREWVLDATIRYIRVVGGPAGHEGLLVGLRSGAVFKVFIDNHFPIEVITHKSPVRCLDLSCDRRKVALVDEQSCIFVYDMKTKEVLFEDTNANSVSWNTDMEEMLCYSGNNMLSIRTGNFPVHRQPLQGFVVGFSGSKIFCLHALTMKTIDVPQSQSLYQYLVRHLFYAELTHNNSN
jgi:intraflagellar transport protein 122